MRTEFGKLLASAVLAAIPVGAAPPPITTFTAHQSAPILMDQLGAVAGKQYQGDGLSVTATADGAQVRCAFQRLDGQVTPEGLWLTSTAGDNSGEHLRVMAVEVGRDTPSALFGDWLHHPETLASTGVVKVAGNSAQFVRDGLTEEYSVSVDGVRQDFIVEHRPSGEGELRVELDVTGATAEPFVNGAQLTMNGSERKLAYRRLRVTDARGQELIARLEVITANRLAVVADDAHATYPVWIDPTFSDADWVSIGGLPGADGTVNAAAFDGSGNLYIGGSFIVVGNTVANRIAKWDGNTWSDLAGGLNGTVNAIVVSGSDLYVGGSFTTAEDGNLTNGIIISVNGIAKWNGSDWLPLDAGVNGTVFALAASGSDLYVGGSFTAASLTSASRVAKWDGLAWSALGLGVGGTVNALAVIGSDVYAGGTFTTAGGSSILRIAKWNGSSWSALGVGIGGGTSPSVNALAVSGTDLYAAGAFTIAGSVSPANNIAKWNGSTWAAVGTGLGSTANSMAVSGGDLYVGGSFTTPATRIAKWDGASWSALGSGMSGTVAALATYGSTVAAGGSFTTTPAMRVATWNGTTWTNLGSGLNSQVNTVAVSGSDVYVGGTFTLPGVASANNIVRWNGSAWSPLAGGLNGTVSALAVSGSDVYAGGAFTIATNAGGISVTVSRIARWNGSAWSALDLGINNTVSALTVSGSDLYAGGGFTTAGSVPAYNVAKWNGTAWSALAGGVNNTVNGAVNALAAIGSDIYAAGDFATATNAGDVAVPANRIAKWDGTTWSALGSGLSSEVNALAVSGTNLYVGGFFSSAGGVTVGRIARWDGNTWSALGSATNNIFVNALAVSGSDLYVGGIFSIAGGYVPANNIAKWDGSTWTALGSGVSGTSIPAVNALAAAAGNLYVGGSFTKAGDKAAGYVAKANIGAATAPGSFSNSVYSPATGFSCTFLNASVGQPYRIQTSLSLTNGTWTDFTNFTYAGPVIITTAPDSTTNKFFRAVSP